MVHVVDERQGFLPARGLLCDLVGGGGVGSEALGFRVSGFQGFRVLGLQGFKVYALEPSTLQPPAPFPKRNKTNPCWHLLARAHGRAEADDIWDRCLLVQLLGWSEKSPLKNIFPLRTYFGYFSNLLPTNYKP